MLLPLALSPSSSITFRTFLGFVNAVSALISFKVAPVSCWPEAGACKLQTLTARQSAKRKKRFCNDVLPVSGVRNDALKTRLSIKGSSLKIWECLLLFMETSPCSFHKIIINYFLDKVRRFNGEGIIHPSYGGLYPYPTPESGMHSSHDGI